MKSTTLIEFSHICAPCIVYVYIPYGAKYNFLTCEHVITCINVAYVRHLMCYHCEIPLKLFLQQILVSLAILAMFSK